MNGFTLHPQTKGQMEWAEQRGVPFIFNGDSGQLYGGLRQAEGMVPSSPQNGYDIPTPDAGNGYGGAYGGAVGHAGLPVGLGTLIGHSQLLKSWPVEHLKKDGTISTQWFFRFRKNGGRVYVGTQTEKSGWKAWPAPSPIILGRNPKPLTIRRTIRRLNRFLDTAMDSAKLLGYTISRSGTAARRRKARS